MVTLSIGVFVTTSVSFSLAVVAAEAPRQVGAIPYSEVRLYIDVQLSNCGIAGQSPR